MHKLGLIIRREYLTRVRKKSFFILTFLTPVLIGAFIALVTLIFSYQGNEHKRFAILDEGKIMKDSFSTSKKNIVFEFRHEPLAVLKDSVKENKFDGIIQIPGVPNLQDKNLVVKYYSDAQLSMDMTDVIEGSIKKAIRNYKIQALSLSQSQLEALDMQIDLDPEPIMASEKKATALTGKIAVALGTFIGFFIYFTVFLYGSMVMRSVMEEKINRIVEVMISSVKPFYLMLGKIIGVGAVGLTQLIIWMILFPTVITLVSAAMGIDHSATIQQPGMTPAAAQMANSEHMDISLWLHEATNQNWFVILPLFLVYYLLGFILFSSLFAAIGSTMSDDLGEGQSLTMLITIPVLIAFYIMMRVVNAPDSSLAVWSSMFPLFSPIVMPARLPFHPPAWQIILSLLFLIAGVLFFVWLSGRIYRIGILMYGKKASLKELGKWIFYKD